MNIVGIGYKASRIIANEKDNKEVVSRSAERVARLLGIIRNTHRRLSALADSG